MHNNGTDSVLTTDATGRLKFKKISLADTQWVSNNNNIYNKSTGNVGIGTLLPTAKFHTLGSMRFESFKNNVFGDSVLITDVNGNLKLTHKWFGETESNSAMTFYNPDEPWYSKRGTLSFFHRRNRDIPDMSQRC